MLTERSIINFLIWIGGMILGPYIVVSALYGNLTPVLAVMSLAGIAFVFGILRDCICVLPILGLYITGKFNFLPLKLAPSDLCLLALIAYYLVAYAALRRQLMKTGPLFLLIPILIIAAIVLYHEHNFGLRSMGEGREGARGAMFMLLAGFGYLCGVSVNSPSAAFFRWVPLISVGLALFSAVPYTLSTIFPGSAPYLYIFTDNINASALAPADDDSIVRNAGPATAASAIIAYLVAYYPVGTWWRPNRWWVAILAIGCLAIILIGGFRSGLVNLAMILAVAGFCYYSWRACLLIVPLIFLLLGAVALQDSHVINLPTSAQRTLSFLPGDWDPSVVAQAEDSSDFRERIKDVYMKEEAQKGPLLGNGFSYDADEFDRYNYLALKQDTPDKYYSSKIFITGKMFHTGWLSLYDGLGLIGGAALVFFNLALILALASLIFGRNAERTSTLFPLKVWTLCQLLPGFIGFFTLFGDIKQFFPYLCAYSVLITHLLRIEKGAPFPISDGTRHIPFPNTFRPADRPALSASS